MPHKHTRREKDLSTFDLPPNQVARPLPPTTQSKRNKGPDNKGQGGKAAKAAPKKNEPKKDLKRKRETAPKDDAPRAFKRLMAYAGGKKTRSGLDNGEIPKTKPKKQQKPGPVAVTENETKAAAEVPKIRPGETMSEFAQRVDQALPLSGLINKTAKQGKDPLGLKVWRTNKERKMHKLYDEWREEERKIKEKKEEELEEEEEKAAEQEEMGVTWKLDMDAQVGGKKKKKGKRAKYLGEAAEAEEDPWAEIIRKRGESKPKWNETAKAPPELHKLQQNKLLKVGGAAVMVDGVPKAAGSLRRREELREVREDVVAAYRKLMEGKRQNKQ